jgi:geranylgeranyl diphosphate synthase type II
MDQVSFYKNLVEEELRRIFKRYQREIKPPLLYYTMRYAVLNGGKRLRPILCLMSYAAVCRDKKNKINYRAVLPLACGLEFVHTFSLIQDDLPSMDNDDFRRGKLTLHRRYNESIALLTSDILFSEAFLLFSSAPISDKVKIKAIELLALICGPQGLAGGQVLDLMYKNKTNKNVQLINQKKTASLISGSIKIGALVAEASESILETLSEAGIYFGLAFQLSDDILDGDCIKNQGTYWELDRYLQKAKRLFTKLGKNYQDFINLAEKIKARIG